MSKVRPVNLEQILSTKDPNIVRLEVTQENPNASSIGILMKGHANVSSNRRRHWAPVMRENLQEFGLADLPMDTPLPNGGVELNPQQFGPSVETIDIVVQEVRTPSSWQDVDGNTVIQNPKQRPVGGEDDENQVIMIADESGDYEGVSRPVFRNTELSFNGEHGGDLLIDTPIARSKGLREEISVSEYEEKVKPGIIQAVNAEVQARVVQA